MLYVINGHDCIDVFLRIEIDYLWVRTSNDHETWNKGAYI